MECIKKYGFYVFECVFILIINVFFGFRAPVMFLGMNIMFFGMAVIFDPVIQRFTAKITCGKTIKDSFRINYPVLLSGVLGLTISVLFM